MVTSNSKSKLNFSIGWVDGVLHFFFFYPKLLTSTQGNDANDVYTFQGVYCRWYVLHVYFYLCHTVQNKPGISQSQAPNMIIVRSEEMHSVEPKHQIKQHQENLEPRLLTGSQMKTNALFSLLSPSLDHATTMKAGTQIRGIPLDVNRMGVVAEKLPVKKSCSSPQGP